MNNQAMNLAYATYGAITVAANAHHRLQGERNPHAKLADIAVERIRLLHGECSAQELATEYKITRGTVYQLQSGQIRGSTFARGGRVTDIGARIKQIRTQTGMTAAVMAHALGVTTSAVTAWERGEKRPRYPRQITALLEG